MTPTSTPRRIDRGILALAIATQEGWFDPDPSPHYLSIPHRCNNPGNLRWAPDRFPQSGRYENYVVFSNPLAGWGALDNDINAKALRGFKLNEAIWIYCPKGDGDNNPQEYVVNVAEWAGLGSNVVMKDVLTGPIHVVGPWSVAPPPGPPRPNFRDPEGLLKLFAR